MEKINKILVINAGSSSMKFQLYQVETKNRFSILAKGLIERIGLTNSAATIEIAKPIKLLTPIKDHNEAANLIIMTLKKAKVIADFAEIAGIGHRIVHGGSEFNSSMVITPTVVEKIEKCISLAPLHNPAALKGYYAFKALNPNIVHVAAFDTSFHMTLLPEKYLYPVPYEWYQKYQVRRYGFHGLSYNYILKKLSLILNKPISSINAIICHLGNGASVCAIKAGQSYNTSMGLTPLDGLMMGTRSGVVDPSILAYMCQITQVTATPKTIFTVTNELNRAAGILGISGISSDLRDVLSAYQSNDRAKLAIVMFVDRIANYIINYANDLENKIDALVFTAGIGENSVHIRQMVIDKIKILALKIVAAKNESDYDDYALISDDDSAFAIYKIKTNEEIIICEDTYNLLLKTIN